MQRGFGCLLAGGDDDGRVAAAAQLADLVADAALAIEPLPGDACCRGDGGEGDGHPGPVELAQRLDGLRVGQLVPPGCRGERGGLAPAGTG